MKKILSILLCLVLLGSAAMAETVIDAGAARGIQINPADVNLPEDGVSPTTGRDLSEVAASVPAGAGFMGLAVTGRYMPVLVQIDNTEGGVGYNSKGAATGYRAPWGIQYADVIYEAPLIRDGDTRLTALFSDIIPTAAGPVRSARMFHGYLREEWDCGICFYGQQEAGATDVNALFRETGASTKAKADEGDSYGMLLFRGTDGSRPWKQYYDVYTGAGVKLMDSHDMTVNVAGVSSLIPANFNAANHTWLFSDDLPDGGDDAEIINVNWAPKSRAEYNSLLEWDEDDECYYRYMYSQSGKTTQYATLTTKDAESVPMAFNNIIVQFTEMDWPTKNQPNPVVTGTGNADYFMGGKHYAGVWQRNSVPERTVFYGADGEEIELQPGRTLIIVMDYQSKNRSVSYE